MCQKTAQAVQTAVPVGEVGVGHWKDDIFVLQSQTTCQEKTITPISQRRGISTTEEEDVISE